MNNYRSAEEMEFWKRNCPIALLEEKLRAAGYLTDGAKAQMETEIAAETAGNFEFAKQSPFPGPIDWGRCQLDVGESWPTSCCQRLKETFSIPTRLRRDWDHIKPHAGRLKTRSAWNANFHTPKQY